MAIDDDAFAALGRKQPISRAYVARLVDGLRRSGAAVVGLDIALTTPTAPSEDAALARAVLDFGEDGVSRVVVAHTGDLAGGPLGDGALMRAVVRGSPRVPWERDGVIRRAALLVPEGAAGSPPQPRHRGAACGHERGRAGRIRAAGARAGPGPASVAHRWLSRGRGPAPLAVVRTSVCDQLRRSRAQLPDHPQRSHGRAGRPGSEPARQSAARPDRADRRDVRGEPRLLPHAPRADARASRSTPTSCTCSPRAGSSSARTGAGGLATQRRSGAGRRRGAGRAAARGGHAGVRCSARVGDRRTGRPAGLRPRRLLGRLPRCRCSPPRSWRSAPRRSTGAASATRSRATSARRDGPGAGRRPEPARRGPQVSILFSDLRGFTTLSERHARRTSPRISTSTSGR